MDSNVSLAVKVGAFVLVGLFLGLALIYGVNNWRMVQPGYQVDVIFESASGLLLGSPVKLAGVDVGEVLELSVTRDRQSATVEVRITIWLPNDISLRSDDEVWIGILGALGEKYVEILPGPGEGQILAHGDQMEGRGVVSELDFTQRVTSTLNAADELLVGLNTLVSDSQIPDRLIAALAEAEALSRQLQNTAQRADGVLEQSEAVASESRETLSTIQNWTPLIALGVIAVPLVMLLGLLL